MCREDSDGLSTLNEQRLVVTEHEELAHDRLERGVASGGLSRAAVHDQLLGMLRNIGVEVVEQHSHRRLCRPRARVQLRPVWSADRSQVAAERLDRVLESDGGHRGACLVRACSARSRLRQFRQLQSVATTKKSPAIVSARTTPPPVAHAIRTTTMAIPP